MSVSTAIDWKEVFQKQAEMDCEWLLEQAFSNNMVFGNIKLRQVSDIQWLRCRIITSGQFRPETDEVLKGLLRQQLESLKRFTRLWTSPDPDNEELAEAWIRQTEATERWEIFMNVLSTFQELEKSIQYAFEEAPVENPVFRTEKDKQLWLTLLKNEQQEFVNGRDIKEIRLLDGDYKLNVHLSPTHSALFMLLSDGEPKTIPFLLQKVFGPHYATEDIREHLSRRISELNMRLEKEWGTPPGKRWIRREIQDCNDMYRLLKP